MSTIETIPDQHRQQQLYWNEMIDLKSGSIEIPWDDG